MIATLASAGAVGLYRLVSRRPLLYFGTAAFLTLGSVVGANAFRQEAGIVSPILATRGGIHVSSDPADITGAIPQEKVVAAIEEWRPVNDPRIMSVPLVREVQQVLQVHGFYKSEIDGRPGQATDLAVRQFQESQGLQVDGMITPLLLTQVRQYGQVNPTPGGDDRSLEERVAELNAASGNDRELVRQIQSALTRANVAELRADGIAGEQTRTAIRTFQALHGMDVTGEPDGDVLKKLTEVGAVH